MKSKNRKWFLVVSILVVLLIPSFIIFYIFGWSGFVSEADNFIKLRLYDGEGREVTNTGVQSVVGGVAGIRYVSADVSIRNVGDVGLNNVRFTVVEPSWFKSALNANTRDIAVGQVAIWSSNLMDISAFESQDVNFLVIVEADYSYGSETRTLNKTGSLSFRVDPDPLADFDVSIVSNVGNSSVIAPPPVVCSESWSCSGWGSCVNSNQVRTCTDLNNCGTVLAKPSVSQVCVPPFETNAVGGVYKLAGVWIKVNGVKYCYNGFSSFKCTSFDAEPVVLTTPEGYPVCARSGYPIASRVYLEKDLQGLVFTVC